MLSTDLDNVHSRLSFTVGVFSLPKPVVLHETVQLSALPCCSFHFMSFYCLLSAVITRQNLFSGDLFPWTRHAYSNTVVSAKVTKKTKKPLLISASCVINDTYCFFLCTPHIAYAHAPHFYLLRSTNAAAYRVHGKEWIVGRQAASLLLAMLHFVYLEVAPFAQSGFVYKPTKATDVSLFFVAVL